jgi:hypothetical protein
MILQYSTRAHRRKRCRRRFQPRLAAFPSNHVHGALIVKTDMILLLIASPGRTIIFNSGWKAWHLRGGD